MIANHQETTERSRLPAWLRGRAWIPLYFGIAAVPAIIFGDSYLMNVFVTIAFFSIVAVSLDLLMGYGGLPTFGHTGFFALGAYVMGVLAAKLGVPLLVGVLAALGVSLLMALIIGYATLRLKEYYYAVATLGFAVIVIQIIGGLPELTGGWSGLRDVPGLNIAGYRIVTDLQYYWVGVIALFLGLVVGRNLVHSRYGRSIRAIANDELAAQTLGIPIAWRKIQLSLVTAGYASIAGSLYGLYLRVPTPANFEIPIMIDMVLMLFLGGKETLWGPIVGATVIRLLPEVMGVFQDFRIAIQGLIFIGILIFMPRGLAGLLTDIWRRFQPASPPPLPASPTGTLPLPLSLRSNHSPTRPLTITPVQPESEQRQPGEKVTSSLGEGWGEGSRSVNDTVLPPIWRPRTETAGEGAPAVLQVHGIAKRFGGLQAVSDVSFQASAGRIKAIIGPNGAGKTTVFNLLTGVLRTDSGSVQLEGRDLVGLAQDETVRAGMVRTYQTPRLFGTMTVLDNVMVGRDALLRAGILASASQLGPTRREEGEAHLVASQLLALVGLGGRAQVLASQLPFGERRLLEIARALATEPTVLLLDEPAAGLNETEKDRLAELLLQLRASGLALVLVEHDMRLVMRVADEILVLNYGQTVADGAPADIQRNPEVIRAYLGEEPVHASS